MMFCRIDTLMTTLSEDDLCHCATLPGWLPDAARHYIAHRQDGVSIRQLAREAGCHASTILRQIRRLESLRDDPLVDHALSRFGRSAGPASPLADQQEPDQMKPSLPEDFKPPVSEATLRRDALLVLRQLAQAGTVLAVAQEMEKAVIVRDRADGSPDRLDVVTRDLAEAMALKDWIACKAPGRVSRYVITSAGRTMLNQLIASSENAARGFAEGMVSFDHRSARPVVEDHGEEDTPGRGRPYQSDSPVAALARRRDRDGAPFLRAEQVRAGERLREDFELAQMGPRMTQDWDRFLTAGVTSSGGQGGGRGQESAGRRVAAALEELGPGLADVVLRVCCHMEGLETAEKKLGWSARSGKIVLRIALDRLHRHYSRQPRDSGMIG